MLKIIRYEEQEVLLFLQHPSSPDYKNWEKIICTELLKSSNCDAIRKVENVIAVVNKLCCSSVSQHQRYKKIILLQVFQIVFYRARRYNRSFGILIGS
jgi:hypothetical protein